MVNSPFPTGAQSVLPSLRSDLQIEAGGNFSDGSPAYLIVDLFAYRFFRVERRIVELLAVWQPLPPPLLMATLARENKIVTTPEELADVAAFLFENGLASEPVNGSSKSLLEKREKQKRSLLQRAIHGFLFFRIPLSRPQRFLDFAWPLLAPLFTRWFALFLTLMAAIGIYLVSRQWDDFLTTLASFMTLEGAVMYAMAILVLKVIHELGHAFMAKRFGVGVPVMGVAFMLLMPILYTETSQAWLLKSRNKRLLIDFGGIIAELAVAVIATTLWVFLPDGNARSIAFVFATLSWVMSLAVNLNPFMRFDGYYILSDLIGIENLQERGFALARWRLREALFALGEPAPELLSKAMTRFLVFHAIGTWIYRFFLYLGIALLIYHYAFKLAGLVLFAIEITWFILLPIKREFARWIERKEAIMKSRRTLLTFMAGLILFAVFLAPISGRVHAPGVLEAGRSHTFFPPLGGQLVELDVAHGQFVEAGKLLGRIQSDELRSRATAAQLEAVVTNLRLRRTASDATERSQLLVLERRSAADQQELEAISDLEQSMTLEAGFPGWIVDVSPDLAEGRFVSPETPLFSLVSNRNPAIRAYIRETALSRVSPGDAGRFVSEDMHVGTMDLKVRSVAKVAAGTIRPETLLDLNGGPVATRRLPDGRHVAAESWYEVTFDLNENPEDNSAGSVPRQLRGTVIIHGTRRSLASSVFSQVAGVLLRESGF